MKLIFWCGLVKCVITEFESFEFFFLNQKNIFVLSERLSLNILNSNLNSVIVKYSCEIPF